MTHSPRSCRAQRSPSQAARWRSAPPQSWQQLSPGLSSAALGKGRAICRNHQRSARMPASAVCHSRTMRWDVHRQGPLLLLLLQLPEPTQPKPVIITSVCGQFPISSRRCAGRGGPGASLDQCRTVSQRAARGAGPGSGWALEPWLGGAGRCVNAAGQPWEQSPCTVQSTEVKALLVLYPQHRSRRGRAAAFPASLSLPPPRAPCAGRCSPWGRHPALPRQPVAAPGCRRALLSCDLSRSINQSKQSTAALN